ncbi:MAG: PEP-CTERM sorting domain-containing protein [Cyanobacteriota bacterium]|nr:PEP-CTERM sorting domain-containing protein [Cyanobacteriota bacterium]
MKTLLAQVAVATTAGTILSLGVMNAAQAASFNFSYTLNNGDILSGMLEGEVQSDGDTVFVSDITMPMFNGAPAPELPFVTSAEFFLGLPTTTPTVSLSGSIMNLLACTPNCFDGFLLDASGIFVGVPSYISGGSYGNSFEPYNPAQWELTAKTPEPASMLALLAVGALGAASKTKSAKKQKAQ